MSLAAILGSFLGTNELLALAGKRKSKGATTKEDKILAASLALAHERERLSKLPVLAQKKIAASPAAQRELSRLTMAAPLCSNWRQFKRVLGRFPPAVLFQILDEEMSAGQMRELSGAERSAKAKSKDELVFGVLLALAERRKYCMHELPPNAQSRIEAAPAALGWVAMVERANEEVLSKLGGWAGFRELLQTPMPSPSDEEWSDTDEDEPGLAQANEGATAGETADWQPMQLSFEAEDWSAIAAPTPISPPVEEGTKEQSSLPPPEPKQQQASWLATLLEASSCMLLPFVIVGVSISLSGPLPGIPGSDQVLHPLAK